MTIARNEKTTPLPSGVLPDGTHRLKLTKRRADLTIPGGWLKWYDIALPEVDLSLTSEDARAWLNALIAAGNAPFHDEVGFVEVHYCTDVVFLIVSTWRHENELWQSAWVQELNVGPQWQPVTRSDGAHRPVFCVWELIAVGFERDAWTNFLRSKRDESNLQAYRSATYEGMG